MSKRLIGWCAMMLAVVSLYVIGVGLAVYERVSLSAEAQPCREVVEHERDHLRRIYDKKAWSLFGGGIGLGISIGILLASFESRIKRKPEPSAGGNAASPRASA